MTDRTSDVEEQASDLDPGIADSDQPNADGEQDTPLTPTRSTRTRPSALDLARAFD